METSSEQSVLGPRRYRNNEKLIAVGDRGWQHAQDNGLIGIKVDFESNNRLVDTRTDHAFMTLCTCSYLGLNHHPKILQGSIDALREAGTNSLAMSTLRIRLNMMARMEEGFRELYGCPTLPGATCSALTAGILPLLASGHVTEDGKPRVMVFDRFCHFSMAYIKPICGDESLVLTSPHNDLNYLEDVCKKYPRVAYVADGAYSMGGLVALEGLLQLQERYGLFLYIDDSHSLSITGERGEGYVRSRLKMNPLTMIVASLAKAFGSSGGVAMLGSEKIFDFLSRNAGPLAWSQNIQTPSVGASLASIELHRSPELRQLQDQLQRNIALFDSQFPSPNAGNGMPIRLIQVGEEDRAIRLSSELYQRGYYCSAVFFPVVARGEAGVRVMMRADMTEQQVRTFCDDVKDILSRF
ncbi:aminotransferase class I/II-fold pyridoxal phosphate-dependent enzyme [Comamonas sp. JC664]|uniref:aminotransferase class I/II-fold pyridoxal phosphate-dependent enzyme n=1 Tax=Comamonas sp. JC664 TaxID=2801917 RepID=UPI00174D3F58|nr:aminotransferase class I/II-fold pyridoxal phosphate-dependent enzyme [Comamonas sp. JC664]MBL0693560.1 aminotransferase class I/II-fold pyridoxal phosphate-dependent enzyme [Comamonas sp. JC664]GHG73183.1 7-keto-8-aminopelargonate synthetase [Comamonas sp. KCTC 72670]